MQKETELKLPYWMGEHRPWLTSSYVQTHGWVVSSNVERGAMQDTNFGHLPIKNRVSFQPGDIIIFNAYDEKETDKGYETDRFYEISEEDIDSMRMGERELLPVGVIVRPPQTSLIAQLNRINKIKTI